MDFDLQFSYEGWTVRYSIISPHVEPTSTSQKNKDVVFVHGTPWSSVVYKPIVQALQARGNYRILIYDLPGYGQSQGYKQEGNQLTFDTDFPGDTSVKFQAQALAALLKHVEFDGADGGSSPAVIAHDIAGTIVLRAHLLHGCEFNSMLLAETNVVLPWGDGFYKLARSDPGAFVKLPPGIFEAVVRAVIQSAVHNKKVLQSGWEDALAKPWLAETSNSDEGNQRQRSFVRQIAQANDADVQEMLDKNVYSQLRCDVKVIWGEQDQWIPKHKIEDMIGKIGPRVKERAFIPDAGHLVMLDQPERFAIEVFDWLSRYGN